MHYTSPHANAEILVHVRAMTTRDKLLKRLCLLGKEKSIENKRSEIAVKVIKVK